MIFHLEVEQGVVPEVALVRQTSWPPCLAPLAPVLQLLLPRFLRLDEDVDKYNRLQVFKKAPLEEGVCQLAEVVVEVRRDQGLRQINQLHRKDLLLGVEQFTEEFLQARSEPDLV